MRTIQAFRFALDPNNAQRSALAAHCGASWFAFNWGLALVKERLEQRESDPSVQVPWNLPALRREWNRAKRDVAPWWSANSKEAYSSGLDALARALNSFSGSRKGKRKERRAGFPRFRKRGRSRQSCRFTTGAIADIRRDSMHKLTTGLAKTYATIVVEELAVANMTKRRRGRGRAAKAGLNRAILDSSLAELRRQLTYKCAWYGSALVTINRHHPSFQDLL
jgi:IS605 OrfB family transposase